MKSKQQIYLPGGNPKGTFTSAAQEIMKRAMPYMGTYNDLYKRNSRAHKSVARGLGQDLGIEIGTENLFFGHGVKEAMQFSARFADWLARGVIGAFEGQGKEPPKIKMLVKAPTYKHVLSQFQGFHSFECKLISSFTFADVEDHGHLHHFNFLERLEDANSIIGYSPDNEFTIGYLDISPCNPSGYIRGLQETKETLHVLTLARIANERLLKSALHRPVSFRREPFVIIEDHIYRGLEFHGQKTASFCQIDNSDLTHSVFGVSKYGLVGMRGSVTVAPKLDVDLMQHWFAEQNSDVSPFSVLACEYMFGDNPKDKVTREKYLKRVTQEYERNILIATSIIDGKARDFLTPAEYQTATDWLTKHGEMAEVAAHQLLQDGIRGIDTINLPQAGFFLLLNFDKMIDYAEDDNYMFTDAIIKFIREVAYHQHAMHMGDSEYMGLDNEYDAVIRFTVALTPAKLVTNLLRLKDLSETMEKIGPLHSNNIPNPRKPHDLGIRLIPSELTAK